MSKDQKDAENLGTQSDLGISKVTLTIRLVPILCQRFEISILLIRWATIALLLAFAINHVDGQVPTNQERPSKEFIQSQIQNLLSSDYASRQSATEILWSLGSVARAELELAAAGMDPEVSNRAKTILNLWNLGFDTDHSSDVMRAATRFMDTSLSEKSTILSFLANKSEFELGFTLLEMVSDDDQKKLFDDFISLEDKLASLAKSDRWQEFHYILSHPMTYRFARTAGIYYRAINGTLESTVESEISHLQKLHQSDKELSPENVRQVIALCRLINRYELAHELAEYLPDSIDRRSAKLNLLKEQGKWNDLAQMMTVGESGESEKQTYPVSQSQAALIYHFTDDEIGYRKCIQELENRRLQAEENGDKDAFEKSQTILRQIGYACLDWPLVESNLPADDPTTAYNLMNLLGKDDSACKMIGLEAGLDARLIWFNQKLSQIKELQIQIQKLERSDEDTEEPRRKLDKTWSLCFEVLQRVSYLGLNDEVLLHSLNMFAEMPAEENVYRRRALVEILVEMEKSEEVWKLVERGFTAEEYPDLLSTLFPGSRTADARFWYSSFDKRYPVAIQRLKAVSGMLRSHLGTIENFNFENEIQSTQSGGDGKVDYYFSRCYLYHDNETESQRHFGMARQLGYSKAERQMAMENFDNQLDQTKNYFEKSWHRTANAAYPLILSEIYQTNGDQEKSRSFQLVAHARWRNSYRNTSAINILGELNRSEWIIPFIQLDVLAMHGTSNSNERYRQTFAEALADSQPINAVIQSRIDLLNQFQDDDVYASTRPLIQARDIAHLRAAHFLDTNQPDKALAVLLRLTDFFKRDAGTIEKFVEQFDRIGATKHADRLFQKVAGDYFSYLEKYPQSSLYQNDYAWVCACANRRTQSMKRHAEKAVRARPNNSSYLDTLAEINFLLGDRDQAIELIQKCIRIDPSKIHYRNQLKRFSQPFR